MTVRRRVGARAGAVLIAAGLAAGGLAALPGTAGAAPCAGLTGLAGSCTTAGTVTITTGGLTVGGPATLTWAATLNGQAQTAYDTLGTDEALYASDLRGLISGNSGSGWRITATAGTFTGTTTSGSATIPDDSVGEVLGFGGGTAGTAGTAPSASCVYVGSCVAPTDSVTYPLFVPTGASATPATIYNAAAGTGTGVVLVGGSLAANPAVWSIALPAAQPADTYTSTITLTIAAGPS